MCCLAGDSHFALALLVTDEAALAAHQTLPNQPFEQFAAYVAVCRAVELGEVQLVRVDIDGPGGAQNKRMFGG